MADPEDKPKCSFEGCTNERKSGLQVLCNGHYQQQHRGEALRPLRARAKKGETRICSFDGCGGEFFSKYLCKPHYEQQRRGKVLKPIRLKIDKSHIPEGFGHCAVCGLLPLSEFNKDSARTGGVNYLCRNCRAEYRVRYNYGISADTVHDMLLMQGGCAICGTNDPSTKGWVVDHDHACCPESKTCGDCVRSILCSKCNIGLGQFLDDPSKLRKAADYIEFHRDKLNLDNAA